MYRTLLFLFLLPCLLLNSHIAETNAVATQDFDVVVIGGTPAGIAGAITAARLGHSVALVEYHNHLGGMSASGLGKSDIVTKEAIAGLFNEFVGRVYDRYVSTYGSESDRVEKCRNGYYYEPSVAESVFNQMVKEQERIEVFVGHRLEEAVRHNKRVVAVRVASRDTDEITEIRARVFVDATYEGDLAAYAGARYRLGRESRAECDEPHAGVIYMDHKTRSLLPGTTGIGDDRLPAYTFRLCLSTDPENSLKPTEPPPEYDRTRYLGYFKDLELGRLDSAVKAFSIAPIPNEKTDVNMKPWPLGFPFAEENVGYPEADWEEREKTTERIRNITLGLLYFLQNDAEVPESDRELASQYGLAKDEFVDNNHFPFQLYVREARRIVGLKLLTENDLTLAPESKRAPAPPDSIACGEFPIDSFPTRKMEPGHEDALEGYILMLNRFTQPYQIPYGVMVPEEVDSLLVPVAVSATHIAFSSVRMEPTWMCLGEAAGVAAHLCVEKECEPREVAVATLQRELLSQGQVIAYFRDLADCGPALPAVQYLGTQGFFDDYEARPHDPLVQSLAARWFLKALEMAGLLRAPGLPTEGYTDEPFTVVECVAALCDTGQLLGLWEIPEEGDLAQFLNAQGLGRDKWKLDPGSKDGQETPVLRGECCMALYLLLERVGK